MPRNVKWKREIIVEGIKEILVKHLFFEIGVAIVEEDQAYLLNDPARLPGKELPSYAFDNDVYMGASFGLKDTDCSATIGGEILIDKNGSRARYFVSAFHPFMDIISERAD